MAIVKRNSIMRGASGKLGDELVARQRNGVTVYCKLPRPYPPKTDKQIANQERFSRANDFAKAAVKDPVRKAYYQSIKKPTQTAFNAAFQDAYNKPEVQVTVKEEIITVKVKAKHRIERVKVITPSKTDFAKQKNTHWEYKLTTPGPVIIQVYDIAGNICITELQTGKT
ncbi:hypothetical protein GFS24_08010 [Chitinophaga sp. SYP-B3965]|uniref:hypothetical protein n=1 Tax=Chitinophaga sp. SYP-B3965 TaxID=2663120 RepID=UPI001299D5FD|nr:hypothetical protein [Chitinophaga sp. SYP-B3965]MRG45055.1 hypothetical protein [Chitinophaga sp. SYP-B3965]